MIRKLHKSSYDDRALLEFSEGQRELLCSNNRSSRCPSFNLSIKQAQQRLIAQGKPEPKVEEITDYIKGLVSHVIRKTLDSNRDI